MVRFCSLLLLLLPAAALAAKCGEVDKKACDGVCRPLKNQVPRPYLYELCQEGCNTRLNQGKADIRKANKVASAHCQHGGFSHACKSGWFGMHDLFTSCTPDDEEWRKMEEDAKAQADIVALQQNEEQEKIAEADLQRVTEEATKRAEAERVNMEASRSAEIDEEEHKKAAASAAHALNAGPDADAAAAADAEAEAAKQAVADAAAKEAAEKEAAAEAAAIKKAADANQAAAAKAAEAAASRAKNDAADEEMHKNEARAAAMEAEDMAQAA